VSKQHLYFSEWLGTLLLVTTVLGSGIMGEQLVEGNIAIALLANTFATVCILFVLIEVLGPVSGAHFNPLVSLLQAARGELGWGLVPGYLLAQFAGAGLGALLAHAMFSLELLQFASKLRGGYGQWLAEIVATGGLIIVILRAPVARVGALVAAYIGAAYWFTASTAFANPAVTFGRMFSDTFAGIAPQSALGFVLSQFIGVVLGYLVHRALGTIKSRNSI
jgi:glycerol uptake facilitator-like aquaporin